MSVKRCHHCGTIMPRTFSVCPYCRMRQPFLGAMLLAAVIIAVAVFAYFIGGQKGTADHQVGTVPGGEEFNRDVPRSEGSSKESVIGDPSGPLNVSHESFKGREEGVGRRSREGEDTKAVQKRDAAQRARGAVELQEQGPGQRASARDGQKRGRSREIASELLTAPASEGVSPPSVPTELSPREEDASLVKSEDGADAEEHADRTSPPDSVAPAKDAVRPVEAVPARD